LTSLIEGLRELAGAAPDTDRFTIPAKPGGVPVAVEYGTGSSYSIALFAPYGAASSSASVGYRAVARPPVAPRPLKILLRRETEWHVMNKASGVNREVQTGDANFDKLVYIDTRTRDDAVVFVLSSPAARAAILTLLVDLEFHSIYIDNADRNIVANLVTFAPLPVGGAQQVLESFLAVVQHALAVEEGGVKPFDGQWVALVALVGGALVGMPVVGSLASPYGCWARAAGAWVYDAGATTCTPPRTSLAAGTAVGLLFGLWVTRVYRGRADSASWRIYASLATLAIAIEVGFVLGSHVMW
jgi:hypothetical protein